MTETLVIKSDIERFEEWTNAFADYDLKIIHWQEVKEEADVDYALVWEPEPGRLADFPSLKIIFSVGAGLDHLKGKNILPEGIPVVRMVESTLTAGMVEYVLYQVLRFHRFMPQYEQDKQDKRWREIIQIPSSNRTVGILGLGVLGSAVGETLIGLGFNVVGWSQSRKYIANVTSYFGDNQLEAMLSRSEILVCLLPLTEETRGILNRATLAKLPRGANLINAGRGPCQVEEDIIAALDSGQLAGAALDVFECEPPGEDNPIWTHPKIYFTPHIASMTLPASSAIHVYDNINRFQSERPLTHVADISKGY